MKDLDIYPDPNVCLEVSLGKLASGGLSTSTDLDRMRMALHAATGCAHRYPCHRAP